jgi:dihydroorotate dehydrogenase electron transfer subunit
LKTVNPDTYICTDDGSKGKKAFTTDILKEKIVDADKKNTMILSCGPRVMMKETARIAIEHGVGCLVSLEARMGCGLGACLTCVVKGTDGKNVRVCKEGPVFNSKDIDWEALDDNA